MAQHTEFAPRNTALDGWEPEIELASKREVFKGFLEGTLLVSTHLAQVIAGLVVAFAVGVGWWGGVAAFVLIGIAVGIGFRQKAVYWSFEVVEWLVLIVAGALIGLVVNMTS